MGLSSTRAMRSLVVLFFFCISIGLVISHGGHEEEEVEEPKLGSFSARNGNYTASWVIFNGYINFTITANTTGWIGIAIPAASGYDAVVGFKDKNEVDKVTDRFIPNGATVTQLDTDVGGHNNLIDTLITYDDKGVATLKFSRQLDTGDFLDSVIQDKVVTVKWAFNDDITTEGQFTNATNGDLTVNFFPPEDDNNAEYEEMKKIKFHGFIMCLMIMVFMTSALVTARYLKKVVVWWFYLHAALTILCLVCMIIALSLIFAAHDNKFKGSWHSAFGLIFIILISIQALIGLWSHFGFDKYRREPPLFPDRVHWWLGRSVFAIGTLNLALGFGQLGEYPASGWLFYVLWLVVVIVVVFYLERSIGQTHESITGHTALESAMEEDSKTRTKKQQKQQRRSAEFLVMFFVPAITALIVTFLGAVLAI